MIDPNHLAIIWGCIVLYYLTRFAYKLDVYTHSKYPDTWKTFLTGLFFLFSLLLSLAWGLGWPFTLKWFAPWLWK